MEPNVFSKAAKQLSLNDYMSFSDEGRSHLGATVPVRVYRLMEYSLCEQLTRQFGREAQIEVFRGAGYRAGVYFVNAYLDVTLPLNGFIALLQRRLEENGVGVLRIERMDAETGEITLTVAEDADCSGLPVLGQAVCNYDEGFLSGVLSAYTGKPYRAVEVDCWATGDRVCRFRLSVGQAEK